MSEGDLGSCTMYVSVNSFPPRSIVDCGSERDLEVSLPRWGHTCVVHENL